MLCLQCGEAAGQGCAVQARCLHPCCTTPPTAHLPCLCCSMRLPSPRDTKRSTPLARRCLSPPQKVVERKDGSSSKTVEERTLSFPSWAAATSCSLKGISTKRLAKLYLLLRGGRWLAVSWGGRRHAGAARQSRGCPAATSAWPWDPAATATQTACCHDHLARLTLHYVPPALTCSVCQV